MEIICCPLVGDSVSFPSGRLDLETCENGGGGGIHMMSRSPSPLYEGSGKTTRLPGPNQPVCQKISLVLATAQRTQRKSGYILSGKGKEEKQ